MECSHGQGKKSASANTDRFPALCDNHYGKSIAGERKEFSILGLDLGVDLSQKEVKTMMVIGRVNVLMDFAILIIANRAKF